MTLIDGDSPLSARQVSLKRFWENLLGGAVLSCVAIASARSQNVLTSALGEIVVGYVVARLVFTPGEFFLVLIFPESFSRKKWVIVSTCVVLFLLSGVFFGALAAQAGQTWLDALLGLWTEGPGSRRMESSVFLLVGCWQSYRFIANPRVRNFGGDIMRLTYGTLFVMVSGVVTFVFAQGFVGRQAGDSLLLMAGVFCLLMSWVEWRIARRPSNRDSA